jgi:hypothetical protein
VFSNVAANIRTAALTEFVLIAVTPDIGDTAPVVYVPGVTSKTVGVSTPENATIAPAILVLVSTTSKA